MNYIVLWLLHEQQKGEQDEKGIKRGKNTHSQGTILRS